jgi:hypothetical protein
MSLRSMMLLVGAGLSCVGAGCDASKPLGGGKSDDSAKAKTSTSKTSKGGKTDSAPASAKPSGEATSGGEVSAATGLATLFMGESEPGVVFLSQKGLKGLPVTVSVPPDWTTNRDDPTTDYVDGELQLYGGKESHANAWFTVVPKVSELAPNIMTLNLQRVRVTGTPAFEAPVEGKLGASALPARLVHGQGTVAMRPGEIWYGIADYSRTESLVFFASLRSDVYPKLRAPLYSVIRSLKVNR